MAHEQLPQQSQYTFVEIAAPVVVLVRTPGMNVIDAKTQRGFFAGRKPSFRVNWGNLQWKSAVSDAIVMRVSNARNFKSGG